jgi:hypothetical protein
MQKTYVIGSGELVAGYAQTLAVGDAVKFDATGSGTMHQLELKSITDYEATLVIQSNPVEFTLSRGSTRAFDLDNDTHDEVLVTLDTISGSRAVIRISYISPPSSGQNYHGNVIMILIAAVVIAAGVALVVVAFYLSRGRREREPLSPREKRPPVIEDKKNSRKGRIEGMLSEGRGLLKSGDTASANRLYIRIKSEYELLGKPDGKLYGRIMKFYADLSDAMK